MRPVLAVMVCSLFLSAVLAQSASAHSRWYWLGRDTVQIGGNSYPHGWSQGYGPDGRMQFNTHRKCTKVSFLAGVTDDSNTDVSIEFSVLDAGGEITSFDAAFGDVVRRTISIRRVLRLGFEAANLTGTGGYAAWGRVRAYCKRPPVYLGVGV